MVRLIASCRGRCPASPRWFQFQNGSINRPRDCRGSERRGQFQFQNGSINRKVSPPGRRQRRSFQFQNGSINSDRSRLPTAEREFQFQNGSINSRRYKAKWALRKHVSILQFQNGSINRTEADKARQYDSCFNSKMVRLIGTRKATPSTAGKFQFQNGSINRS